MTIPSNSDSAPARPSGRQPDENDDLVAPFERLGAISARTHIHSRGWKRPEPLERLVWDAEAVFGP
ncbi:MAG: hypothetical protein J0I30_00455, partial [Burkholderiales bacterium]|nr:hypothetical protein [Burkholderiales bacterium]